MKYIFYAILLYLAFQFIFKLVIPVFIASRKIKKGFREMQARMEEQMRQQQQYRSAQSASPTPPGNEQKEKLGDYIEFEEVKQTSFPGNSRQTEFIPLSKSQP